MSFTRVFRQALALDLCFGKVNALRQLIVQYELCIVVPQASHIALLDYPRYVKIVFHIALSSVAK